MTEKKEKDKKHKKGSILYENLDEMEYEEVMQRLYALEKLTSGVKLKEKKEK
jgi:hypothetical protein